MFADAVGGAGTFDRRSVLQTGDARAVALNSAGYPPELRDRVSRLNVPVLILQGIEDSPADGGSIYTSVGMARAFEAALREAGKTVAAVYYEGSGHNGIFSSASQFEREVQTVAGFLKRHE